MLEPTEAPEIINAVLNVVALLVLRQVLAELKDHHRRD